MPPPRCAAPKTRCWKGGPTPRKFGKLSPTSPPQPADDPSAVHPLLQVRPVRRIGVVAITPDRGLAGGLHSTVNRRVAQFILAQDAPVRTVVVGRKGRDFMVRTGQDIQAVFTDLSDRPVLTDTSPVSGMVIGSYENGEVDEVYLVYAKFVSTMSQQAVVEKLLPVDPAPLSGAQLSGYIYEPDTLTVLGALLPQFVDMEVYHAMLEAIASEQSARMVAMRSATDNANSLAEDLTLVMNKLRQDSITNELLDLVGGQIAQQG